MNRSIYCLASALVAASASWCQSAPIQWPISAGGNGHYYDVVAVADQVTWEAARFSAANTILNGTAGYLATITSSAEKDFVVGQFGDAIRAKWLGGFQSPGSAEPAGGWQWITGEPFSYTNWGIGEPNNSGGHENHLDFATAGSDTLGVWNDLDGLNPPATFVNGYVVEFVPEPSTFALAALAVAALLFVNRRKAAA